ncbi:hypothetical protein [Aquabacter cavernae]|uniref:hypothetical protein n=1 Tax=Aquabacter cavernae TaxID=2496029 RepID=UPI000F8F1C91|nr:hypothetical protein [Aquabacter cavernae]
MSDEKPEATKSLWYAVLDLSIKGLSALGVITLGIVGWQLQSEVQRRNSLDKTTELNAATHLPAVQILAQLQVVFSAASEEASLDPAVGNLSQLKVATWKPRYVMGALRLPADIDLLIPFAPLTIYENGQLIATDHKVPFHIAASMAADVWQALPYVKAICARFKDGGQSGQIRLLYDDPKRPSLYFFQEPGIARPGDQFVWLNAGGLSVWREWLPAQGFPLRKMCEADLRQLFIDVAVGAAEVSRRIVSKYPMLAEKAVDLRTQALTLQDALLK